MTTHGLRSHPVYLLHRRIHNRCYLESYRDYPNWGGRGITMADEFKNDIEAF